MISLGAQVFISGDDNFNAAVGLRFRAAGESPWRDGMPLLRVSSEATSGQVLSGQFAGGLFELAPDTQYEVEVHVTDADGPIDQTTVLNVRTRPVPIGPRNPRILAVADSAQLADALVAAQPGDVVTLADGTYSGTFALTASGTSQNPIVIRGARSGGAVMDGQGCPACTVLEIFGNYVQVEDLTIQHAYRAVAFQGVGTHHNTIRRVTAADVRLGIGAGANQEDFYICDNTLQGRLEWPLTFGDNGGINANDDGIVVAGVGHVICHNRISGFGDGIRVEAGARAVDVYGNELLWTYRNGINLDGIEGNVRAFRNRITNAFSAVSCQPIPGGPAFVFRNLIVNVAETQFRLGALEDPTQESSGVFVFHNTVVRPYLAFNLSSIDIARHFQIENNLFVGPQTPAGDFVFQWDQPTVDSTGTLDWNGYYPNGAFEYGYASEQGGVSFPAWAAVQQDGRWEQHGVLFSGSPFRSGLTGMAGLPSGGGHLVKVSAQDLSLADDSPAIDAARVLPNLGGYYLGAAPDLGALESGCPVPRFGPRPVGEDESNDVRGCSPDPDSEVPNAGSRLGQMVLGQSCSAADGFAAPLSSPGALVWVLFWALSRHRRWQHP